MTRQTPPPDRIGSAPRRGLSAGWTWALLAAVVLGFAAFAFSPVWQPWLAAARSPEALVTQGEGLYLQHCAPCHGVGAGGQQPGQPNGGTRPDGTYIAPALNGTAHAWHHPPDALFAYVKKGSPVPESTMKGWGDKLSDADIEAMLAYIQSLWPERLRQRYRGMHGQG